MSTSPKGFISTKRLDNLPVKQLIEDYSSKTDYCLKNKKCLTGCVLPIVVYKSFNGYENEIYSKFYPQTAYEQFDIDGKKPNTVIQRYICGKGLFPAIIRAVMKIKDLNGIKSY